MAIKSERATISIGDITLNAYMLPDGSYRLAGRNVTDAVKEPANSLSRIMGVKSLKALPHADPSLLQVRADTGETFVPVAIEDAVAYWGLMGAKGNAKAMALVVALATESLERRADRVFGVKRTEEERDARLALRVKRVDTFRGWTDCIKQWQQSHGIYGTEQGDAMFRELVVKVNLTLFGKRHFKCDRDTMTQKQQVKIMTFEQNLQDRYRQDRHIEDIVQECLDFSTGK